MIIMVNLGDQTALKNSISLTHLDSTSTSAISDTPDQVLRRIVKRLSNLAPQQTLNIPDEEKNEIESNCNNINGCIIEGSTGNVDLINTNNTHIEPVEKSNHFEKLIQDVRDKYSIGGYNRLKGGKHQKNNMGSNVSRHSGKGLSGRRTQSSGSLFTEKATAVNGFGYRANNIHKTNENGITNGANNQSAAEDVDTVDSGPAIAEDSSQISTTIVVNVGDRNQFTDGLLNHLESDDVCPEIERYHYADNKNTVNDRTVYVTLRNQLPDHFDQSSLRQTSPYIETSEKDSSKNAGNTFRTNHDIRPDMQIKLPTNRSIVDVGCDQGYGSERSPEDELPPSLPLMVIMHQPEIHHPPWDFNKFIDGCEYDFITKDCCFVVQVPKGPRGLGLSVSGGVDTNAAFPGLIRIKRLFPNQSAWCTGMLQPGDILLQANDTPLTGLTNYEALEVLRTAPSHVKLTVCRPRDEQYRKLSPPAEPPKPPQRSLPNNLPLEPLSPIQTHFSGEFEIIMVKQQGSLGFTLRKEDESVLGHYVRALVREPATTDGRIQPGDKIVAVNDVPLCPMTHEQAVIFLRQASDSVKLRLYRDNAQTPIASMSPTNSESRALCNNNRQKACLRPEAMNLLIDLAYKNKKVNLESDSVKSSIHSNTTSPRRLRRGNNKNSSTTTSNISQCETDKTDTKSFNYPTYIVTSQPSSLCSDSEASTLSQCSFVVQPHQNSTAILKDTYIVEAEPDSEFYNEDELWKLMGADHKDRPSTLDLASNSHSTPITSRKPRFQFSVAANSLELNNLDKEALDAPVYNKISGQLREQYNHENNQDFTSLPCETFLVACRTENDLLPSNNTFGHKNPLYQSVHVQLTTATANDGPDIGKTEGTKNLIKWKGVMFGAEDENNTSECNSSDVGALSTNPTPGAIEEMDVIGIINEEDGFKIITVELNRGWNSRLGFSLRSDSDTQQTFISAIYNDSVAAKDGRLRVGDRILCVNGESLENVPTAHIIDLLRIIRGAMVLTVKRKIE